MRSTTQTAGPLPPDTVLHRLIDSHGRWRIVAALARVLLHRRRVAARPDRLTDHLRRDIGLPERGPEPTLFIVPRG